MDRDAIGEPRSPAAAPALFPGEVHVWRIELPSEDRRAAARRALGEVLAGYLGGLETVELRVAANGKPQLATAPERLSFNLSHSSELALVAIAPGGAEVGVDIERLRPRRDLVRLAARWLPKADAKAVAVATAEERETVFYAAWTRHEARVKCTGTGLDAEPAGEDIVAQQLDIYPGYVAAVALAGAGADGVRISVRRFRPDG